MEIKKEKNRIAIIGKIYHLIFDPQDPLRVKLFMPPGQPVADLCVLSGCHQVGKFDEFSRLGKPRIRTKPDKIRIELATKSSLWKNKLLIFECQDDSFQYYGSIEGRGSLERVEYFGGNAPSKDYSGSFMPAGFIRPGKEKEGWIGSIPHFRRFFLPEPNACFKQYFWSGEYAEIHPRQNDHFWGSNWMFTPGPFCYCWDTGTGKDWVAVGLAPRPGEYNFNDFRYWGGETFSFSVDYEGHTLIRGGWETPRMVFVFGNNEYEALEKYVTWLKEHFYVNIPHREIPRWWREPIFCGWGEQCYEARVVKIDPQLLATQKNYEKYLAILQSHGVRPGIVVIDYKWQTYQGHWEPHPERWKNMRGFIDQQHRDGKKVLLWLNGWEHGSAPVEELVTRYGKPIPGIFGEPIADPSHPGYERRIRESIRRQLSPDPDCLNADGFKVDITHNTPSGRDLKVYGKIWGTELLKRVMSIIYDESKKIKPDALIEAHTANPYFAEVVDVLRLNDIFTDRNSVVELMFHRAKVAKIAGRYWLIDMDNWPVPTREALMEYLQAQPQMGIPSLYYATHTDLSQEKFTRKDYRLIAEIWKKYRAGL